MLEALNEPGFYVVMLSFELFLCTVAAVGIACAADMFGCWYTDEEGEQE